MNSMQIRCFLEAAKYKSFSKAASQLYISQPTISRNISLLEEEVGFSLFNRTSFHGIELTEAGMIMHDALTSAQEIVSSALETAQQVQQKKKCISHWDY